MVPAKRRGSELVKLLKYALCLAILVGLADCSGMGPQGWDVKSAVTPPEGQPYILVRVTPAVTKVLAKVIPRLVGEFTDRRRPADLRFGVGDVVSVTIFEAASGGLFIPMEAGVRPGNFITLPTQSV